MVFKRYNINIHHPEHMAWWPLNSHRRNVHGYNEAWRRFLRDTDGLSREKIIDFGQTLMKEYGF